MHNISDRAKITYQLIYLSFILVILILAIVAYATISAAWFAKNEQVRVLGMVVSSGTDGMDIKSAKCYPVTQISGGTYTFDTNTPEEWDSLPRYDRNNLSYSQYKHAVVVEIIYESTGTGTAFSLFAEHQNIQIDTDKNGTPETEVDSTAFFSNLNYNLISNIVRFKRGTVTAAGTFVAATPAENEIDSFLSYNTSPAYVITQDTDVAKRSDAIPLATATVEASGSGENVSMFFVMEYDTKALNFICDERSKTQYADVPVIYYPDIMIYLLENGGTA